MKAYIDTLDFYSIKPEAKLKPRPKKDYAGIGAVIFTFTVLSIVIALSIYTVWQIAYGQEAFDPLSTKCVFFHSEQVVILSIGGVDDNLCNQQDGLNTLAYYAAQGYEIKAAFQNAQSLKNVIYLQKMP